MKCLICDKETDKCFSMDIDLPKFPYCKDHEFDVQMYLILAMGKDEIFSADSWLKSARKTATTKKSKKKRGNKS